MLYSPAHRPRGRQEYPAPKSTQEDIDIHADGHTRFGSRHTVLEIDTGW